MSASDYTVTVTDSAKAVHTAKVNSTTSKATLTGIPSGNCTVSVTAPDDYQASANPSSFTLTTNGQAINIVSSQLGGISINLSGTMSASDYTVTVTDSGKAVHTVKVNSTTLAASLTGIPVGSCTVTVTAPDGYQATASPSSFTLTTSGQAVTVASIIPTTTITAKNYGGEILPGLNLQITNTSTGKTTTAITNANGQATFSGLAAGTYTATLTDSANNIVGSKSNFTVNAGSHTSVKVEFDIAAIAYELVNTSDGLVDFIFDLQVGGIHVYNGSDVKHVKAHQSTMTMLSGYYLKAGTKYQGYWLDYMTDPPFYFYEDTIPSGCRYFGFFIAHRGDSMGATLSW